MWRFEQAGFGCVSMHAADGDFFFDECSTTGLLARSRAGEAEDIGEGQYFFDEACRFFHRTFGDQFEIAGDVDMGGTVYLAGWLAIGVVVREDHFEVGSTNMEKLV